MCLSDTTHRVKTSRVGPQSERVEYICMECGCDNGGMIRGAPYDPHWSMSRHSRRRE
jgi:hypothetical protein